MEDSSNKPQQIAIAEELKKLDSSEIKIIRFGGYPHGKLRIDSSDTLVRAKDKESERLIFLSIKEADISHEKLMSIVNSGHLAEFVRDVYVHEIKWEGMC